MKTKSELIFEDFLAVNNVTFEKIQETTTPRPDYLVSIGGTELIFELKELTKDEKFGVVGDPSFPHVKGFSGTIGEHVRRAIEGARKQIQYGAKQGTPSVLLVYNGFDRVFQMVGTDDHRSLRINADQVAFCVPALSLCFRHPSRRSPAHRSQQNATPQKCSLVH